MRIAYLMVLVVGITGVSATGCKKIASLVSNKAASAATEAGGGDAANASIGNYNKGFNLLIDDPQKMIEEYFSKIPKEGPQDGTKYTLFPRHNFAQNKIADIKKAFDEGEKAAPEELKHLAPLAKACSSDIEKVLETYKAAHQYYDAEDYKDDKGAKGKELHASFVKAAETFEQDLQKFENALSVIEEKQMAEELKQHEADKSYGYWFRVYNQKANQLIKAKKKDAYLAAFAEVEKAHAGMTAFASGKSDLNAAYKAYVNQADRYLASAKKLKRSFEEAAPKDEDLERGHESLINDYNNMIGTSNSLRELEANNLLK